MHSCLKDLKMWDIIQYVGPNGEKYDYPFVHYDNTKIMVRVLHNGCFVNAFLDLKNTLNLKIIKAK
jgi:hypothetical protein